MTDDTQLAHIWLSFSIKKCNKRIYVTTPLNLFHYHNHLKFKHYHWIVYKFIRYIKKNYLPSFTNLNGDPNCLSISSLEYPQEFSCKKYNFK